MKIFGGVWLLVVLFFVASLGGNCWGAKKETMPSYKVGIGDQLEIQVWHEDELSRKAVTVRLDGYITLPLIGDVMADGRTTSAIAKIVTKKLTDYVSEPSVTVILVANRSRTYYLIGKVAHPGEFPITHALTVLQAIARAGGFQEWAKKDDVKVVRRQQGQDTILKFDYGDIVDGKVGGNFLVKPGDTIIVP